MFGLFIVEAGREPRQLLTTDGKPVVAETGSEAAEIARLCAAGNYWPINYDAVKVQPRRLLNDAWKTRELGRFADGTYIALPWANLPNRDATAEHFAHISTVDGARIAYTQDATKGAGDIQTRVKPGRYLAQYYGDVFDAPTIARMAAEFDTQFGEGNALLLADTQDEIERVYENGPRSCMAYPASHFSSRMHPCRIYAAGDLAVAYMERGGMITARALVWPSKKLFGRVYGDETRLVDLLESAGYEPGELTGARMLRVKAGGGFIMPYIDGDGTAGDEGDYLVLGGRGISADNQNGLSEPMYSCEACGDDVDEDDAQSDDHGNTYCEHCYNERFGYCERYDETCERESMQEVICNSRYGSRGRITQYWGERAIENEAFTCAGNGNVYSNDFLVELADGTEWSQEYFEDHGSVCEGSSECYAHDDMVQLEDGTHWSKDWFEANGVTVDGKLYDKDDAPEPEDTQDTEATDGDEVQA